MEFSQRGNSKAIRPLANSRPPCADSDSGIKMMTGEKRMGTLPEEEKLFTYADYKTWELKEGERYELIYGKIYPMFGAGMDAAVSNAPNARHQSMLTELITQFHQFFRGKPCKVYPAPYDVRLFFAEDESD
ncbi:MAG TPA: hypothetical protein DEQ14_10745, partial [Treponema sp.]|nr:hypothetical protein [Treponema sp.]